MKLDFNFITIIRKSAFLIIFFIGIILIYNLTKSMVDSTGYDSLTGMSMAADKRTTYVLISIFGLIGYFLEVVREIFK